MVARHSLFIFLVQLVTAANSTDNQNCDTTPEPSTCLAKGERDAEGHSDETTTQTKSASTTIPDSCELVMAESTIEDSGWGIFSLIPRKRGSRVMYGDVVIQFTDATRQQDEHFMMQHVLEDYVIEAQETGGNFEGDNVVSMIPGVGMLANAYYGNQNVLPFAPSVDEGGLTRSDSPGVGAISHYHNYTWFVKNDLDVGDELFLSHSKEWFEKRNYDIDENASSRSRPSISFLREHGYCIDNLKSGMSRLKQAGRGAFATRDMDIGAIVSPVPVLPIPASSLEVRRKKQKKNGNGSTSQQLLRNYCLGHKNSTILLYPYAPIVNLINHYPKPNVRLQWSKKTVDSSVLESRDLIMHEANGDDNKSPSQRPQLLLELIATTPIKKGDEIYLDYGREWEKNWFSHINAWQSATAHYAPAYVMDDATGQLRTESEQKDYPYPDNVKTTCFYRYSDRDESERSPQQSASSGAPVTAFRWKLTKGLFELKNLRPCSVVRRTQNEKNNRNIYAVRILNRPGLPDEEVIPKGQIHIVTHVPRHAIQFADVAYSTDQHLEGAFRQSIGLNDDIFPTAWMDLYDD